MGNLKKWGKNFLDYCFTSLHTSRMWEERSLISNTILYKCNINYNQLMKDEKGEGK